MRWKDTGNECQGDDDTEDDAKPAGEHGAEFMHGIERQGDVHPHVDQTETEDHHSADVMHHEQPEVVGQLQTHTDRQIKYICEANEI